VVARDDRLDLIPVSVDQLPERAHDHVRHATSLRDSEPPKVTGNDVARQAGRRRIAASVEEADLPY
jgi:hypothetical protein